MAGRRCSSNATYPQRLIAPGEKRLAWSLNTAGNPPHDSESEKLILDFTRFTQGWSAYTIKDSGILIGDIRFAMLPDSARSLWSISYLEKNSDQKSITEVIMDRQVNKTDWNHLKELLLGEDKNYQKVD
jgi:hypothetical protein